MEKKHGGQRVPTCSNCGSTDMDSYTVRHCRVCKTNSWYGQPGIRKDADLIQAQEAQDANLQNRLKKQDASNAFTSSVPIDEFYETDHDQQPCNETSTAITSTEDAKSDNTVKKQDASNAFTANTNLSKKPENQLAAEHSIHTTAASCFVENRPMCRLCGPISHWSWSPTEQCRICPRCWTPE